MAMIVFHDVADAPSASKHRKGAAAVVDPALGEELTRVYPQLDADAMETLRPLAVSEKEITTSDGRW